MINFVAIVHVQTALKLAQTAAQHLHLVVTPNALIVCPLSVCLSVCLMFDVCKNDFCKKVLYNFNETWGISWYYSLVL